MKQQQQNNNQILTFTNQCKQPQKSFIPSQFYQQYQRQVAKKIFNPIDQVNLFAQFDIKYTPLSKYQRFNFKMKETFLNYHIIKFEVKIAHFQMDLIILNQNIDNPLSADDIETCGNYGQIYFVQSMKQNFIIKSLQYKESGSQNFDTVFSKILKEWAIFRICSALGCAPKAERYFGFDLIVFNDCIHVAMERGEKYSYDRYHKALSIKQELSLMHSFSIVHSDIKPDNIIFSPAHDKFVFIDFGFSQILAEKQGFKTESYFKGTPQYCSAQMLSLLTSEKSKYIDFFYNDLNGLKISLKNFSRENEFKQKQAQYYNIQPQFNYIWKIKQPDSKINNPQILFLFSLFKYWYLHKNIPRLNTILTFNDSQLIKTHFPQLLLFIRTIYPTVFLPTIFYQHFSYYELSIEYQQIKSMQRREKQFIFNVIQQREDEQSEQNLFDIRRKRFNQIQLANRNLDNFANYELIFAFLMSQQTYQKVGEQQIFGMLLKCLRFDKKNLALNQKLQLSGMFKRIKKLNLSQNEEKSLEDIKLVFTLMINYLIQGQFTQWKRGKGFDIFYQAVMLDININESILQYLALITKENKTIVGKFILPYEIQEFIQLIMLKDMRKADYLSSLRCSLEIELSRSKESILHSKISRTSNLVIFNLIQRYFNQQNLTFNQIKLIEEAGSKIEYTKLNVYLARAIFYYKSKQHFLNIYNQNTIRHVKELYKQYKQQLSLTLVFSFNLRFYQSFDHHKLSYLGNEMKSLIGCQAIYQSFVFEKFIFLYNSENMSQDLILSYLQQISIDHVHVDSFLDVQIMLLFSKFTENQKFLKQNSELIKSVFQIKKLNEIQLDKGSSSSNNNVQIKVILFIKLSSIIPQIKIVLQKLQKQYKQMYIEASQSRPKNQDEIKQTLLFRQKCLIFLTRYYQYSKESQKHLSLLYQMRQVYRDLQSDVEYLNCFYKIILSFYCNKRKIQEERYTTVQYFDELFNVIIQKELAVFLLMKCKKSLLLILFEFYLAIHQFSKIYKLLELLTKCILVNPFETYLHIYIESIYFLYQKNNNIFQFSQLRNNMEKSYFANPYSALNLIYCVYQERESVEMINILKFIALKLDFLSNFAKKNVLAKYYQIIFKTTNFPQKLKYYLMKRQAKYSTDLKTLKQWSKLDKSNIKIKKSPINKQYLSQFKIKSAKYIL